MTFLIRIHLRCSNSRRIGTSFMLGICVDSIWSFVSAPNYGKSNFHEAETHLSKIKINYVQGKKNNLQFLV